MNKIVYQLTIEDVQKVAQGELGRDLSFEEIVFLEERIAEKIPWYDAIAEAINEQTVS